MPYKKYSGLLLFVILLVFILIQIPNLDFLLPDFAVEDEMVAVNGFYQLAAFDFKGGAFYKYPGLLFWLLAFAFYPAYLVYNFKTLIHLKGLYDLKFFLSHPSLPEPSAVYLGRVESLLAGIAAVWIFYKIFSKKIGERPSLIASLVLISSPAWLFSSSVLKNDTYLLCAVLVLIHACFEIAQKARSRDYLLAGFALGLCLAAKYHVFALVPVMVAHWLSKSGMPFAKKIFNAKLVSSLALAAVVFCVLSPAQLLHPFKTISSLGLEMAIQTQSLPLFKASNQLWYQLPMLFQLLCAFPLAMGIIAYLLAAAGLLFVRKSFAKNDLLIFLSYPVFLFLIFSGLTRLGYPHLYLPMVPFLAVPAGVFIDRLLAKNIILKTTGVVLIAASVLFNVFAFQRLNRCQSLLIEESFAQTAKLGDHKNKTAAFFPYRPLAGSKYQQDFAFFPQFLLTEQWLEQNHPEKILVHQTFFLAYLNHPEIESRAGLGFEALVQGRAGYRLEKEWDAELKWAKFYKYLFPDLKNLSVGLYRSTSWSGP